MDTKSSSPKERQHVCSGVWLAALVTAITLLSLSMTLFVAGAVCLIVRAMRRTDSLAYPPIGSCVDVQRLKPASTALFIAGAVTGPLDVMLLILWIVAYCGARKPRKRLQKSAAQGRERQKGLRVLRPSLLLCCNRFGVVDGHLRWSIHMHGRTYRRESFSSSSQAHSKSASSSSSFLRGDSRIRHKSLCTTGGCTIYSERGQKRAAHWIASGAV